MHISVCKCIIHLCEFTGFATATRISGHFSTTLTEVYLCCFISCKANVRVQFAKMWHGQHFPNGLILYCYVCVLYYSHQDIGALFNYPNRGFFYNFLSVVRQMPGYNLPRWGMARTSKTFFLFIVMYVPFSVFCLCVNVYCTTSTGCQPNCS
jgi:hypothetical protein